MYKKLTSGIIAIVLIFSLFPAVAMAEERPKVLVFIIDGLSWEAFEAADTPNMDKIFVAGGPVTSEHTGYTWPGRAKIFTGAYSSTSGIVGNIFYDRELGKMVRLDPRYWDEYLEAQTLLQVADEARLSVGYVSCLWWVSQVEGIDFGIDPKSTVEQPNVPDYLHYLIGDPRTVTPFFPPPDEFGFETAEQYMGLVEWTTEAALKILEHEGMPDIMFVDYKATDLVGHVVGPWIGDYVGKYGTEFKEIIEYTDAHIGKILKKLEEMGELQNTIIILTSDHGMAFYYGGDAPEAVYYQHNPFRVIGELENLNVEVSFITWGTGSHIYLKNPNEPNAYETDLAIAIEYFEELPGAEVYVDLAEIHLDHPRSGDFFVTFEEPYSLTPPFFKGRGMHGSCIERSMVVPLLIKGPGIGPDAWIGDSIIDIAPTLAELIGIPIPAQADGQVSIILE